MRAQEWIVSSRSKDSEGRRRYPRQWGDRLETLIGSFERRRPLSSAQKEGRDGQHLALDIRREIRSDE